MVRREQAELVGEFPARGPVRWDVGGLLFFFRRGELLERERERERWGMKRERGGEREKTDRKDPHNRLYLV